MLKRVVAERRRRWRSWLALALVVGLGGGVVLGALAGARRTETAYPRFVASHRPSDVLVPGANPFGLIGGVDLGDVAGLPEVAEVARAGVALLFTGQTDRGRKIGASDMFPLSTPDDHLGTVMEQWRMLDGRRADPTRPDETVLSFLAAQRLHLRVGDTFTLHFFRADTFGQVAIDLLTHFQSRLEQGARNGEQSMRDLADGPLMRFHVVGIEASPAEFPPLLAALAPPAHLTPAFYRDYQNTVVGTPLLFTRLNKGTAELTAFKADVEHLAAGRSVSFITARDNQTAKVQRAINIEAVAARLLAATTALALVVIVGQALLRQALTESDENETLRALGMTSTQLFALSMIRGAIVAGVGAVAAVLIAIVASPLTPVGLARIAEPNPGLRFDGLVLGLGFLALVLAVLLLAVPAAVRASRPRRNVVGRDATRAARVPTRGLPTSGVVGLRFAFASGRGPGAVPVATTVLGVVLGTAMLVAVTGFNTSLARLLATPRLYGWTWSAYTGAPGLPDIGGPLTPALAAYPPVQELAVGTVTQLTLDHLRVDVLAVDQARGRVFPPIIAGRPPTHDDEVALGANSLRRLHKGLGDSVTATIGYRTLSLRIVGRAVLPDIGDAGQLGSGAVMTFNAVHTLLDDARRNVFLARFRPGTDPSAAFAVMRSALEPVPTRDAERPHDLVEVTRVHSLPSLLSLVLAGLAAAVLAHTILSSVRLRRRDLAVLKSLGFVRRQVSVAVLWQASALTLTALIAAVPLGLAAGRWSWTVFASRLGVVSEPVAPILALALIVPLTIVVANALAAVPALVAARTPSAAILRTE